MRNKKIRTIVLTALSGCLLLSITAAAAASEGSGYSVYENVVDEIMGTQNATFTTTFAIKDNGDIDISGTSVKKLEGAKLSLKTNITTATFTKETETSRIDGETIIKDGENYYLKDALSGDKNHRSEKKIKFSANGLRFNEMVLDTFFGDVKEQFILDGDMISLKLNGEQIPELAKLAISTVIKEKDNRKESNYFRFRNSNLKDVLKDLPKLKNIDIKSFSLSARVNGDMLNENDFDIVVTGEDEDEISHEFEVTAETKVSAVNSTKADTIDITGKQIKTMGNELKGHLEIENNEKI